MVVAAPRYTSNALVKCYQYRESLQGSVRPMTDNGSWYCMDVITKIVNRWYAEQST